MLLRAYYSDLVSQNAGDTNDIMQTSYVSSINNNIKTIDFNKKQKTPEPEKRDLSLLDLYCGCGGMSTGLCLGAHGGGVNLVAVLLLPKHLRCAIT